VRDVVESRNAADKRCAPLTESIRKMLMATDKITTRKPLSAEARARIAASLKKHYAEHPQSQETKDKRAAAVRAACAKREPIVRSEEWKRKHSEAKKGKKRSPGALAKFSESVRRAWVEKRDTLMAARRRGADNRLAKGTSYIGVHKRLGNTEKGACRAESIGLASCSKDAEEWALLHDVPTIMDETRGLAYSPDLSRYVPLCVKCHRNYDGNTKTAWENSRESRMASMCRGEAHKKAHAGQRKLTDEDVAEIIRRQAGGETVSALAAWFGVSESLVSNVVNGKRRCSND
jgi:hypothetical protein